MYRWKHFNEKLVVTMPVADRIPQQGVKIIMAFLILFVVGILPAFDSIILNVVKEEFAKTISCLIGIQWLYTSIFSTFELLWSYSTYVNQNISSKLMYGEMVWRVVIFGMHFMCTWVQLILIRKGHHFLLATAAGSICHLAYNIIASG